jgi:hypothetical protein
MHCHYWLQSSNDGMPFVADGTAGQIDSNFPLGFYGFLDTAPRLLRDIYSEGVPSVIVTRPLSRQPIAGSMGRD